MENRYPRVEINLAHLQHNVSKVVEKCGSFGIQVAGVIKGATGIPEVARAFDKGGRMHSSPHQGLNSLKMPSMPV